MKIILKDVIIVHPQQKQLKEKTNLLIIDGIIEKVGNLEKEESRDAKVFELDGKVITPGFFDMHVHFREPGREDEETVQTGSDSAANGGFTGVACMPNTEPAIDSAQVIELIKKQAIGHLVDVHPIAAATVGRKGELLSPMAELFEAGAVGYSDDGVSVKSAGMLKRAFEYASMYNLPVIEHCEDESLAGGAMNESINSTLLGLSPIPSIAEDIIVMRDIMVAEYVRGKLHIAHISTKNAVDMVREAKKKGIKVTAEVTPHHFVLTDDAVKSYDTNVKMNPPLRMREDVDAVIAGLKDGTIDCICSDHAPHSPEEKETEFEFAPNGILGLETEVGLSLSELYHKKVLTLEMIVEKLAINPREILNLPVPRIERGEKANLTILDLDEVWTVNIDKFKSKSRNSPFDKKLLTGKAIGVINNGRMFFEDEFTGI